MLQIANSNLLECNFRVKLQLELFAFSEVCVTGNTCKLLGNHSLSIVRKGKSADLE